MKKVLIITYYWAPSGGPGAHRILNFAKYLSRFGWQPIVLTVKKGEFPAIDQTLISKIPENCSVYKTNSIEPNLLYKKFIGMKEGDSIPVAVLSEKNSNWKLKAANFVRLNLFVPDAKIGWIPFAVNMGKKIISQHKPDLILSSSPPPSVHLIAGKLAGWSRTKWLADFRDPWTDIYHLDNIRRNPVSSYIDRKLEKKVLNSADRISTVSSNIISLFQKKSAENIQIELIPNGFDEEELTGLDKSEKFEKFTLIYTGKIGSQQNAVDLWKALHNLTKNNEEFRNNFQLVFFGNISDKIKQDISANIPVEQLHFYKYADHKTMLQNLFKSHISLLLIPDTQKNEGIVTGKLFDYLAVRNFILGIGPVNGDAAGILQRTGAGKMFSYSDRESIENEILSRFQSWKNGNSLSLDEDEIIKYSREKQTARLSRIFDEML